MPDVSPTEALWPRVAALPLVIEACGVRPAERVRCKLDAQATWAPALVDEVAATAAVDTIDFKGHAAFPEDPHDLPAIADRLDDQLHRVSYDAPISGPEDIGVGRRQIELLAALFHPDAPNDVAPSAYDEDDPAEPLPASPLAPRPAAVGFRWAA